MTVRMVGCIRPTLSGRGAVFAEIVFNPIVMGAVMVTTVLFALSTLLSDLAAAALDPRTRDKL